MTRAKYEQPRSKVQARRDHPATLTVTIPAKIAHAMRLQAGDSMEWIWITEGFESYVKIKKVATCKVGLT